MALTRTQKADQLTELKDSMSKTQSLILAHYIGLKVSEVSDLRAKLRKENAEMKVAKKTLMQLAAKELGWPELSDELLSGPVACIFSFVDPLSGAQVAFKYAKGHPQVELIGGMFEGKLLTKQEAMSLAQIPGKLQLLSMFASMCNSPLSAFARSLDEIAKKGGIEAAKAGEVAPAPQAEAPTVEAKVEAPAAETPAPSSAEATAGEPAAEAATPEAPAADAPTAA